MAVSANKKAIQLLGTALMLAYFTAPNQPLKLSAACSYFQTSVRTRTALKKKFLSSYFELVNTKFDPKQILNPKVIVFPISLLTLKGKHTLVKQEF